MRRYSLACAGLLFLAGCAAPTPSPTSSGTTSPSLTAATTPTPNPTEKALMLQLPNPGGTCTASQLIQGPATSTYDFSTLFSRVAEAFEPLRNAGVDCVLAVPTVVGLAAAFGPFA